MGATGIDVPIVGIGTAFLGHNSPEEAASGNPSSDARLAVEALYTAIESGATLIDTAPLYNGTRSETAVGEALRERPDLRERVIVTSKAGRLREGKDYSRDAILRSVTASLERLGLDYLDVVSVHDAQEHDPAEVLGAGGALEALRELQHQKVIGHVGIACSDPEVNAGYVETGEFEVVVVADAWSLLTQKMAERILPAAERFGTGIIIATPLERGLLATGPMTGRRYQSRNFSDEVLTHVGTIQRIAGEHGVSLLAVALQWLTRHPLVASAVPGSRSPEEAASNAAAAETDIPDELWAALDPLIHDVAVDRGKNILYGGATKQVSS